MRKQLHAAKGLSDEELEFQNQVTIFGEVGNAKKYMFKDAIERTVHPR